MASLSTQNGKADLSLTLKIGFLVTYLILIVCALSGHGQMTHITLVRFHISMGETSSLLICFQYKDRNLSQQDLEIIYWDVMHQYK